MTTLRHNPAYRRLRVGGRSPLGSASYWLGADHLILVEDTGVAEKSRRIELRDIAALVAAPTEAWRLLNGTLGMTLGLLLVPFLYYALAPGSHGPPLFALGLASVIVLWLLVRHLVKGPTCRCVLHTRVQAWTLPQVTRRRDAVRLIAELQPAVLAAQAGEAAPPAASPEAAPPPLAA